MPDYIALNRNQTVSETDTFSEERYAQFGRNLGERTRDVLDVGCNMGRGGRILKQIKPNLRLTGLDCVPERIDRLPPGIYEAGVCGFSTDLPFPANRFDAILAGEFIEHLSRDDVHRTLQEFLRVLRLGGQLLLTTPNPEYLRNKLTGATVLGGAHLSEYSPGKLKGTLRKAGFTQISLRPSGKVTRIFGEICPFLFVYGSYLSIAVKPRPATLDSSRMDFSLVASHSERR